MLRPHGRLVVVDFAPHDQEFLRVDHAHRRLGFASETINQWMDTAGLDLITHESLTPGRRFRRQDRDLALGRRVTGAQLPATSSPTRKRSRDACLVRDLPAQDTGRIGDVVAVDRPARAAPAELRVGHVRRQRLRRRAQPRDRRAPRRPDVADHRRPRHVRRPAAGDGRRRDPALLGGRACATSSPCAAIRPAASATGTSRIPTATATPPIWSPASSASYDAEISVSAYPEKHPESPTVDADLDMLAAKVDAGADACDHAVLLRQRPLLPLRRSRPRTRHRHPDRAGHHAGAELRADEQLRGQVRRVDPDPAGGPLRRARGRSAHAQAGRRQRRHRTGARAGRRRRDRPALLHDEPRRARLLDLPPARRPPGPAIRHDAHEAVPA